MRKEKHILFPLSFLVLSMIFQSALAQEKLVPTERPPEVKKADGWDFILTPALSTAVSSNYRVVGQPEGSSVSVGVNVDAGAAMRYGVHEWRNTLKITEQWTRTPVLSEFTKSTDIFKVESIYLFHLIDWLGPFTQLNLDATLIESFAVQPQTTQWQITYNEGTSITRTAQHLRLSDWFHPLTIKETAGFFAKPVAKDEYSFEARLGFGGLHTIADGQLTVKDDGTTADRIEVVELRSFNQAGGVLDLTLYGQLMAKKIVYKLFAGFMMPFVNELQAGDDRNFAELTNMEFSATLSFKVFEWLSIDYVFRAVRQPQLVDQFQIQNNLLLSASYSFFKPEKKK